jgi:hypothetical protein
VAAAARRAKLKGALFWLTYRHSDGRAAGVVVVESRGRSRPDTNLTSPVLS